MPNRLLIAACAAALTASAFADQAHEHSGAQAKPPASAPAGTMHEMMGRMQEQMKQMQAATDPKERERLMNEHMKTMQEFMPMMKGMDQSAPQTAR
jgi:hypothetical protein